MLLKRSRPGKSGIFFAIWPRWTPDGWVACEWLHWELIESWGWGSGDTYRYARYVPNKAYDAGERAQARFYSKPGDTFLTPPDISKCGKLRTDGPTPCHYPHCTCMIVGGSTCGDDWDHTRWDR